MRFYFHFVENLDWIVEKVGGGQWTLGFRLFCVYIDWILFSLKTETGREELEKVDPEFESRAQVPSLLGPCGSALRI